MWGSKRMFGIEKAQEPAWKSRVGIGLRSQLRFARYVVMQVMRAGISSASSTIGTSADVHWFGLEVPNLPITVQVASSH